MGFPSQLVVAMAGLDKEMVDVKSGRRSNVVVPFQHLGTVEETETKVPRASATNR